MHQYYNINYMQQKVMHIYIAVTCIHRCKQKQKKEMENKNNNQPMLSIDYI